MSREHTWRNPYRNFEILMEMGMRMRIWGDLLGLLSAKDILCVCAYRQYTVQHFTTGLALRFYNAYPNVRNCNGCLGFKRCGFDLMIRRISKRDLFLYVGVWLRGSEASKPNHLA